jgi:putative inorganic carbon (hco3(-)) transporter
MALADAAVGRAIGRARERGRGIAVALADAELWLVGPFLALGLALPRLLATALGLAILFWLARWIAWGRFTVPTPGDLPLAGLILVMPVTLWVTALPDVTRGQVLLLVAGIVFYYAIANWVRTVRRERAFVLFLVGLGLVAAIVAPVAVAWVTAIKLTIIPEAIYKRLPLLASLPVHPNVLAGALVLVLPVPLALVMFDGPAMPRRQRLASIAAVIGMAGIILLTKSRGALLAAAVAGAVLCLLRWRRGWIAIVAGALLAGLGMWMIGFGQVAAKLIDTGSTVGVGNRLEIWTRGIYVVQDFPYTGIGMGTFKQVTNALYPYLLLGPNADVPHAHNLFLQVAVDLGVPGLVAWLSVLLLAAFSAWQVYREGRRQGLPWVAGLGAGLLCAQVAMTVHGILDAAVWGAHSGMVVWALWGLTAASYNLHPTAGKAE